MSYESLFVSTEEPDRLFVTDHQTGVPRRVRPDELQAQLLEQGVALLQGVTRFIDTANARSYRPHLPVASVAQVFEAHLVRQGGGEHLGWEAALPPVEARPAKTVAVFELAMGNGAPFPQPSGTFELSLDGEHLVSFCLTKRSRRWRGADCEAYFDVRRVQTAALGGSFSLDEHIRDESTFVDGFMFLTLPARLLNPLRAPRLRIDAVNPLPSSNWVRVGRTYEPTWADVIVPGLDAALGGADQPSAFGRTVLIGDIHNHSGESTFIERQPPGVGAGAPCGVGSRRSLFEHARDVAGLDFFCLSEHDWQLSEEDWKHLNDLTDEFGADEGSFITLHGYEWTSPSYGHRNVYFRDRPGPWSYAADPELPMNTILDGHPTPADLWEMLRASGTECITVPHHMSAKQFPLSLDNFHDEDFDRVAEIYSCWGDSLEHAQAVSAFTGRVAELAFINSVRAGYKVGFIASSDSHDGHPGTAQGTAVRNHLFHYFGSGQVGVVVPEGSRPQVFDALRARHSFATTGENIVACTQIDGQVMGSVLQGSRLARSPVIEVHARSFLPFEELTIYRNGYPAQSIAAGEVTELDFNWTDPAYSPGDEASYFVKVVRVDGERAWTSPIWIAG